MPGVEGQAVFQGLPAKISGTVSAPDQGNGGTVEGNVAALNRQTEALRSLREARNPGITTGEMGQVQAPKAIDPWALPGDGRGDSQMRQQEYASLLSSAASLSDAAGRERGFGGSKRAAAKTNAAAAKVAAAQAFATPFMENAKVTADQQASRNSLAGQLAQSGASQASAQAAAQQRAMEAQQQAGVDQQKFGLDQQRLALEQGKAGSQAAMNLANQAKTELGIQQEMELSELFKQMSALDTGSPEYKKLAQLYTLRKRGMEKDADPLAGFAATQ